VYFCASTFDPDHVAIYDPVRFILKKV
jgi:hypothetical protein